MHQPTILLFAALAACTHPSTPETDPIQDALDRDVAAIAETGVVGVEAEHAIDGVRWHASAGFSDLATESPIAEDSRFRIASTTKAFVAALTLMLVEEGRLSLDDTVEQWLPGLIDANGNDGSRITVRQLLQHRSGLPNHVDDLVAELGAAPSAEAFDAVLLRVWDPVDLVGLAVSHPPVAEPGERFVYSDTGYVVVGLVIGAATGEPWEDVLADRILGPLDLAATTVPSTPDLPDPHLHGYAALPFADGWTDVTAIDPSSLDAAAAVVSTPGDVDRFFEALLDGTLLGPALLGEMTDGLPIEDGADVTYGLGLARVPLSCGSGYFMHSGDTLGFHTRNGVTEQGDRSVTLAISADGDFEAEAAALIDRALCSDP